MPNPDAEQSNPQAADALYEACGDLLLERIRDGKKFPSSFRNSHTVVFDFFQPPVNRTPMTISLRSGRETQDIRAQIYVAA